MESEEARKALDLARKHDLGGNTDGALKWARKSVAIYSTPEATELVARLEVHGASGKASGGTAPEASGTSTATAPATGATKRNTAPASSGASEGKREYTEAQIQIVRRVKRAGGDFYSVLDIEKSADENQVKKSYRKVRLVHEFAHSPPQLALQLHPDKNRAPGADEAFKRTSGPFASLLTLQLSPRHLRCSLTRTSVRCTIASVATQRAALEALPRRPRVPPVALQGRGCVLDLHRRSTLKTCSTCSLAAGCMACMAVRNSSATPAKLTAQALHRALHSHSGDRAFVPTTTEGAQAPMRSVRKRTDRRRARATTRHSCSSCCRCSS